MDKMIYFFSSEHTDDSPQGKHILGGKGDGLAKMTKMGLPVPPGFSISAELCDYFYRHKKTHHPDLRESVQEAIIRLEKITKKKFGGNPPLLVSVRSGAAVSMPGMMDTILNLGLNDQTVLVLANQSNNPRFAYDSYRRFIQMFSNVVEGMDEREFEKVLYTHKMRLGVTTDSELSAEVLQEIVEEYKAIYRKNKGQDFPQDVYEQLWSAITSVFLSWNTERALAYRKINSIHGLLGTAVNICTMVFGNMGEDSGTGVAFTRNPSTGEKEVFGEFLPNAQGEDIVAGIRTPYKLSELETRNPKIHAQFIEICEILEKNYRDMQDIEFTIEQGTLYLLQTRSGKRTGQAALKIATDMVEEGLVSKEESLLLINAEQVADSFLPIMDPDFKNPPILATGVKASFGVAIGKIIFDAKKLEAIEDNESYILVCEETSPEHLMAMYKAKGILTSKGGATSHAAVVTRAMGKPCIVGCVDVQIDEHAKTMKVAGKTFHEGDIISLNASEGQVIDGAVPILLPKMDSKEIQTIMEYAKSIKKLGIRVNADTAKECELALEFGAEGVGLARTEHMFFDKDRILFMREMIFADTQEKRKQALIKLLPFQQKDFYDIFQVMNGKPVTIRLLDPPLHEFLPKEEQDKQELAKHMNISLDEIQKKSAMLHEINPMLGLRGCRLGLVHPEITEMQIQAIARAACELRKKTSIDPMVEIMVPLTGTVGEMQLTKELILKTIEEVCTEMKISFHYSIGTMIEIPRATLIADKIAEEAEFFSFGTNDLTQMTYGFSRDDSHTFIEYYQTTKILPYNPFVQVDEEGVGQLIHMAVERGKKTRENIKLGVCGEHAGNPNSIYFFHNAGMHYVSCSTFRVPTAILAAAQAVILENKNHKMID